MMTVTVTTHSDLYVTRIVKPLTTGTPRKVRGQLEAQLEGQEEGQQ